MCHGFHVSGIFFFFLVILHFSNLSGDVKGEYTRWACSLLPPYENIYIWDAGGTLSGAAHFIHFSQVEKCIFHALVIISFLCSKTLLPELLMQMLWRFGQQWGRYFSLPAICWLGKPLKNNSERPYEWYLLMFKVGIICFTLKAVVFLGLHWETSHVLIFQTWQIVSF